MAQDSRGLRWNLGAKRVGHQKPVFVRSTVQPTKDLPPGELSLSGKVGSNEALVKSASFGIVERVGLIKSVLMGHEDYLNAPLLIGDCASVNGANLNCYNAWSRDR